MGRGQREEHDIPNTMVYNTQYDDNCWKGIRYQLRPMHNGIKPTKASGLDLPSYLCDAQKEALPSYHIKGLCN